MKQITDLTKCPICDNARVEMVDADYTEDRHFITEDYGCPNCKAVWTINYKAYEITQIDRNNTDETAMSETIATVVDPQEDRDERERG